jgi:hypothetical protein
LTAEQVALLLGFQGHDIPVLVAKRLLKPLGNPVQNSVKYFAAADVEGCINNVPLLDRMTKAVSSRWTEKNQKQKPSVPGVIMAEAA